MFVKHIVAMFLSLMAEITPASHTFFHRLFSYGTQTALLSKLQSFAMHGNTSLDVKISCNILDLFEQKQTSVK